MINTFLKYVHVHCKISYIGKQNKNHRIAFKNLTINIITGYLFNNKK